MSASRLQQAAELLGAGQAERARVLIQAHLRQAPADRAGNTLMARALLALNQGVQAEHFARRALSAAPGDLDASVLVGMCLFAARQFEALQKLMTPVLEQHPYSRNARGLLYRAAMLGRHFQTAARLAREGVARFPDDEEWRQLEYFALTSIGRAEWAVAAIRAGQARLPESPRLASLLCHGLNYIDAPPGEVFEAHRSYGRLVAAAAERAGGGARLPAVGPDRRLRVGVISADLRRHSVGYFAEPLIAGLEPAAFELVVFATNPREDEVTARIKPRTAAWHGVHGLGMAELAMMIRRERIDIVLDLQGHTDGQRLEALAFKPAPVIVTWCGYPNTTGVPAVDARVVDAITDPPGAEAQHTERLIRLEGGFLCYRPPEHAPAVAPGRGAGKPVTFGSFNALMKFSDRMLGVWAAVLAAVPGSRLVIKNHHVSSEECRVDVLARMRGVGIDPDRVELIGYADDPAEHLGLYASIDVGLDTFPYCGTTTTCEAMWMGVPVVTRVGATHAGRVGLSLLSRVGLEGLAAADDASYVRIASALAGDHERRAELRAALRGRMASSSLCDAAGFAARFGAGLRALWRERCNAPGA